MQNGQKTFTSVGGCLGAVSMLVNERILREVSLRFSTHSRVPVHMRLSYVNMIYTKQFDLAPTYDIRCLVSAITYSTSRDHSDCQRRIAESTNFKTSLH